MAHTQPWESMVIAICRDPFTPALNRQGGKKCIGYEIALDAGGAAEAAEDFPMAGTRIDECAVRLITELLSKCQGFLHAAGRIEHAGMRHDAKETA